MSTGAQYVVGAYAVIWFGLLIYTIVLGGRSARIARQLEIIAHTVGVGGDERIEPAPAPADEPSRLREAGQVAQALDAR